MRREVAGNALGYASPALSTSPSMVREAILRFEDEAWHSGHFASRLGLVRAWYACRDRTGQWRFGSSKYVGYDGLTAENYLDLSDKGLLDGRRTEEQLRKWCHELDPSTDLYCELSARLSQFLAAHRKAPNARARINIFKEDHAEAFGEGPDTLGAAVVDLVVAVAEFLPRSQLEFLRRRLAVIGLEANGSPDKRE
ncbi:MAG: hypothetical protein OXH79_06835 [Boseongicola sp.]|nr:hypothetical protein [Boseongicola sp.]